MYITPNGIKISCDTSYSEFKAQIEAALNLYIEEKVSEYTPEISITENGLIIVEGSNWGPYLEKLNDDINASASRFENLSSQIKNNFSYNSAPDWNKDITNVTSELKKLTLTIANNYNDAVREAYIKYLKMQYKNRLLEDGQLRNKFFSPGIDIYDCEQAKKKRYEN